MSDFLGGKTKDELMEESRKAAMERHQIRQKLAEEQKARELAAMEANRKSESEEIADLIASVKAELTQIAPGSIFAVRDVLCALQKTVEIVDYVFRRDRQRENQNQYENPKP